MSEQSIAAKQAKWLVVGHGSVGSWLRQLLESHGQLVQVFDPEPRTPFPPTSRCRDIEAGAAEADYVVSCVGASAAKEVAAAVGDRPSLLFDWNTMTPAAKRDLVDAGASDLVDVALLDTIDVEDAAPLLAVSGAGQLRAQLLLERLGFAVVAVGSEPGAAAELKQLRSLFMKTLEALVVEHAAVLAGEENGEVVATSIERSLGPVFARFQETLLQSNRLHARRRGRELAEAIEVVRVRGHSAGLARAGVQVLEHAAAAWECPQAPAAGSTTAELARHLAAAAAL